MQRVERILQRVNELPFSPVTGKILEMARDERVGAREIAWVISQDQGFTARLLKIANSPYYGQARAVTTVTQAVPVLGIDTISSLVTALGSFSYAGSDDNGVLSMRELWEHSIGCAIWARQLARHIGHRGAEETFIAGLLHDMGKAVFFRFFKKEFLDAAAMALAEGSELSAAERRILETDHAAAGATVAAKWNLPETLIHTVRYHHMPVSLPEGLDSSTRKTIALVHVADILSEHFQIGRAIENHLHMIAPETWELLGIDLGVCQDLLGSVLGEVSEFRNMCSLYSVQGKPNGKATMVARPNPSMAKLAPKPAPISRPIVTAPAPAAERSKVPQLDQLLDGVKQLAMLAGIDDLGPNIAEQARALLDADAACVLLPHGSDLEVVGAANLPLLYGKHFPIDASLTGWVAKMGELMALPEIEKAADSWEKKLFTAIGFHSHLFVPIDWAGKRLAVLAIHSRRRRFWSTDHVSLVNMFCGFVAVVLENAGLYREAEEKAKALEQLTENLQSALNVKTRFLGKVSHELRSPLCVITGYANLIAEETFGALPIEVQRCVARILAQADGLLQILTYMFEVSELESGKLNVKHGPVKIIDLLDEVAAQVPKLIGDKPIQFSTDYAACQGKIVTDPDRLVQVLTHILANAAKFTEHGKIVLTAQVADKQLKISVSDTGIGIAPEHQQMIFEGFCQVDDDDTRRYEGIGIGLYLVRRLLALLGGHVTVESQLGVGSRFDVWLPVSEAE